MKRASLAGFVLLSFFAFCAHATLSEAAPGPKMVVKQDTFNFGEVKEGKVIEHTFKVLNEGDAKLEIKNVRPG